MMRFAKGSPIQGPQFQHNKGSDTWQWGAKQRTGEKNRKQ